MTRLCIYHKDCWDGFAAAWVVRHKLGEDNVDFWPATYGDDIPPYDMLEDREVIIVDFSYPREQMCDIITTARHTIVLDHHKKAADALATLEDEFGFQVSVVFDMERSGALITWEYFFNEAPPKLLQHISDRDLWNFEFTNTKKVTAALASYEFHFPTWDSLMNQSMYDQLVREGTVLLKKLRNDVSAVINSAKLYMEFEGHTVPLVNCPYFLASEVGNALAAQHPFSVMWYISNTGHIKVSLRSSDRVDVNEVAKKFGGGGHVNAAGFSINPNAEDDMTRYFLNSMSGAKQLGVE